MVRIYRAFDVAQRWNGRYDKIDTNKYRAVVRCYMRNEKPATAQSYIHTKNGKILNNKLMNHLKK